MKLLLHACCGPCSLEPVRVLQEAGHDITIAYINSNIHPQTEYEQRKATLLSWAESVGLPVLEGIYNPSSWEASVSEALSNPNATRADRCRMCYRLRFEEAAEYAHTHGFDALSSTLSVSPYQFSDIISEELSSAAISRGITPLFQDFTPYFPEATRLSKELGMYRQKYCGCRFSEAEAEAEREERKRQRRAEKEARNQARKGTTA